MKGKIKFTLVICFFCLVNACASPVSPVAKEKEQVGLNSSAGNELLRYLSFSPYFTKEGRLVPGRYKSDSDLLEFCQSIATKTPARSGSISFFEINCLTEKPFYTSAGRFCGENKIYVMRLPRKRPVELTIFSCIYTDVNGTLTYEAFICAFVNGKWKIQESNGPSNISSIENGG